ncbi:CCR4-NOT transcriptional complex subunit [Lachnellula subtilissima]|uniref:CCR4-NOT transcriptional complex subunit n=1 Tax=Lachnellula subtilissima TaxID=602034 RepID=A0A8H8UDU2_9HELO|nr:CCR4-NOT transcriptional complex subunit [Lachnellula subtilissima]
MGTRNRVLSFMSSFSNRDSSSPASAAPLKTRQDSFKYEPPRQELSKDAGATGASTVHSYNMDNSSPQPRIQRERASSRPMSMVQTYQPPLMDVSQDTLPELQPIFTFLNSHANKLYQEGYFLKLDDQNTHGRANADRTWTECFAQLVGTVLSLWDAADLDAAGQDGEVLPKFINLTDASIKMIESLPTRSDNEAPLQNVLSVSTAGKNRYLLHFNSHHSLVQWTAGIRLAMYEHATLQEAYTGALIAGKGKALNNINVIMERSKLRSEDWARVRFGAGTPWRRCWCVITPPDEKEIQKIQKQVNKKKSAYDRSRSPILKGDIKFYDTRKTKKPLIDASTLVKVEGSITIHSNPPSTTEGFVFVMPEVHPAVSGFEMMLRWLFPVFDTFALYGRPGRLIADTSDPQSLMFAMPKHRRYGYLEILDVTGLIVEQGSANWRESEWRRKLKELTKKRMTAIENGSGTNSRYSSRKSTRNSYGPSRSRIQFDDAASVKSSPSASWGRAPGIDGPFGGVPRTDSAPAGVAFAPQRQNSLARHRSVSETHDLDRYQGQSSHYDGVHDQPPPPPPHSVSISGREGSGLRYKSEMASTPERVSLEDDQAARATPVRELQELQATTSPEPVSAPPAFLHAPGSMPASKPHDSPELRKANSRMSNATLSQLAGAGGVAAAYHGESRTSEDQRHQNVGQVSEERGQRGVPSDANIYELGSTIKFPFLFRKFFFYAAFRFRFSNKSSSTAYAVSSYFSKNIPSNSQITTGPMPPLPDNKGNAPNSRTYQPPQIFSSPDSKNQNLPSQQGHFPQQSADLTASTISQPSRLQTSQSITRKPLPLRKESLPAPSPVETASSTGSFARHVIDQAAFDMIGRRETLHPGSLVHRQKSGASSFYGDTASTDSPDYASTARPSIDTQKSVEKPRAGIKKTVGDPEAGMPQLGDIRSSIHIDFGPTLNYASDRLPQQQGPARGQSPGPAQIYGNDDPRYGSPTRGISPGPGMNHPAEKAPQRRSPRPDSPGQSTPPNRNINTPEHSHYRNVSAESRTLAWQPGMATAIGAKSSVQQHGITPEQFVQQRAAAATTPLYAHQRQQSGNTLGRNTPTPPLVRNRSSELLVQQGHSRNSSADLLQRPSSRGASIALGLSGSGDIASKLSAREQEHLARVTGQPLINMAQNNNRQATPGSGLVGAISAREQEKQQIKQGINSQAVQQAIAQRQQQAMYQQYPEQMAGGQRLSQYGNMPQYPPPQYPIQHQGQQAWVSPAPNVFAQGGGWATPSPGYAAPDQARQSPSFYPAQQQYFPPQQQGGRGRGNSGGYHGHGF